MGSKSTKKSKILTFPVYPQNTKMDSDKCPMDLETAFLVPERCFSPPGWRPRRLAPRVNCLWARISFSPYGAQKRAKGPNGDPGVPAWLWVAVGSKTTKKSKFLTFPVYPQNTKMDSDKCPMDLETAFLVPERCFSPPGWRPRRLAPRVNCLWARISFSPYGAQKRAKGPNGDPGVPAWLGVPVGSKCIKNRKF